MGILNVASLKPYNHQQYFTCKFATETIPKKHLTGLFEIYKTNSLKNFKQMSQSDYSTAFQCIIFYKGKIKMLG